LAPAIAVQSQKARLSDTPKPGQLQITPRIVPARARSLKKGWPRQALNGKLD